MSLGDLKWHGLAMAVQAARAAAVALNVALRQLVGRAAARLDVPQSSLVVAFGLHQGKWSWQCTLAHDGEVTLGTTADDPVSALANLVDEAEQP